VGTDVCWRDFRLCSPDLEHRSEGLLPEKSEDDLPSATRLGGGRCATIAVAESGLIYLGRTYGSTPDERVMRLPGDDIIADSKVQTDHAVTIEAPPSSA